MLSSACLLKDIPDEVMLYVLAPEWMTMYFVSSLTVPETDNNDDEVMKPSEGEVIIGAFGGALS